MLATHSLQKLPKYADSSRYFLISEIVHFTLFVKVGAPLVSVLPSIVLNKSSNTIFLLSFTASAATFTMIRFSNSYRYFLMVFFSVIATRLAHFANSAASLNHVEKNASLYDTGTLKSSVFSYTTALASVP